MERRTFLKSLLAGVGLAATPSILLAEPEPVRRYWQVPGNAPVGKAGPFEHGIVGPSGNVLFSFNSCPDWHRAAHLEALAKSYAMDAPGYQTYQQWKESKCAVTLSPAKLELAVALAPYSPADQVMGILVTGKVPDAR